MIKRYPLIIVLICFVIGVLHSGQVESNSISKQTLSVEEKEAFLLKLIRSVMFELHYSPSKIDNDFSLSVYERLLKQLDPNKQFLYKSDIQKLDRYKYLIDDEIEGVNLGIFPATYKMIVQRIKEAQKITDTILNKPFDFTVDEMYVVEPDHRDYSSTKEEMLELWRKKMKYSTLSNYRDLLKSQEKSIDSLDTIKTEVELEREAREMTQKTMKDYFEILLELERKEWYEDYLNTFIGEYDPHTRFIPAEDKDEFDMDISGKLEGIGAVLQREEGITKVVRLISGGPAWKAGELEAGDKILKVRQENEKNPVSIIGMRLDKAVDLIKGPKGTKVFLTIQKKDETIQTIMIVRDVVELKESYLKGLKTTYQNHNWGIIKLPKFYIDFNDLEARNSTSDMKKELQKMNKENIQGLILDLRGNGGGSLKTAVEITGLFIKKGPIVQVRSSQEIDILKDEDSKIYWERPLVVLIDESSASASEILAAAIQDYGRGVILGSKHSHGKGTVQTLINLDRLVKNRNKLFPEGVGSLKLTTQKFYRINGNSTQLKGVQSDVVMLDRYSYIDTGERDLDNPLECDSINSLSFEKWKIKSFKKIIKKSQNRIDKSEKMKVMHKWASLIKESRDTIPLSYELYDTQIKERVQKYEHYDSLTQITDDKIPFQLLASDKERIEKDTVLKDRMDKWIESLQSDIYVKEAVNILLELEKN